MKPAVSDWLMAVILHIGLIGSLVLPQLTQLKQQRPKPLPTMIDAPVYWVSIENVVDNPNPSQNSGEVTTQPLSTLPSQLPNTQSSKAVNSQQANATKSVATKNPIKEVGKETVKQITDVNKSEQSKVQPSNKVKLSNEVKPSNEAKVKTSVAETKPAIEKPATKSVQVPDEKAMANKPVARTDNTNPVSKNAENAVEKQTLKTTTAQTSQVKTGDSKPTIANKPAIESKQTTEVKSQPIAQSIAKSETKPETKSEAKPKSTSESKAEKPDNTAQWKSQFVATVNRNKSYPNTARKAGIEGSVLIGVHVTADSQIHCYVKQSSGNSQLDNAAVQAANRAVASMGSRLSSSRGFSFDFYVDYVLDN